MSGLREAIRQLLDSTADATDGHTLVAKDAAERIEERVRAALAATGDSGGPLDVLPIEQQRRDERDRLLEWGGLTRALDATDDEMIARGHRLSSYSNEEYAAVLRDKIAAEYARLSSKEAGG